MKNATPEQESSALLDSKDSSAATQRKQILALLREHHSINTPEFRHKYDIMAPAPRIWELRREGYNIQKVLETVEGHNGRKHHGVARYYLANVKSASNDDSSEVAA